MTIQQYNIEQIPIPDNDKEVIFKDAKNREICVKKKWLFDLEDMR